MSQPPPNFQYSLDFFRLGLYTGLVDKASLLAWADAQLMNNQYMEQQVELVELSLAQPYSEKEITALITTFIGSASTLTGSRLLLNALYQQQDLQHTIGQLKEVLYLLQLYPEEEEELEEMYYNFDFDSHFYPMPIAYRVAAQQKALQFLACYQDYQLANLEQLPILETQLAIRLKTYFQAS